MEWLIPVLQGASFAAQEDYDRAVERLQAAGQHQPEHPVIANNLAWAMMKRHEQLTEKMLTNAESDEIRRA